MSAMSREEGEELRGNSSCATKVKKPDNASDVSLVHACKECGIAISKQGRDRLFCSTECRSAFNNRKKARGAVLIDLFMRARFDRKGTGAGAYSEMCTLASVWREEDKKAGRASF
ncbi:transcriptional regulator [Thalassospira marina]|nr:transcriptional regulator [Thalassospira marina]